MRLALTVALVMLAFAANSVLNRLAVDRFGTDPLVFAAIRVAAGAAMLALLARGRLALGRARVGGALALALYMLGFSWAYLALGAGLGALILFGTVQLVMFGWAVRAGEAVPLVRWLGAGVALAGLVLLLWPGGGDAVSLPGAAAMAAAGVGWGAYSLLGRGAPRPLEATAGNFVLCLPLVLLPLLAATGPVTPAGAVTAVVAGAVTSGLGYALWYRVLPRLAATIAAVAQLSVPVIAVAAGALLLGEALSLRLLLAAALVLGGIGLSLYRTRGSSGS